MPNLQVISKEQHASKRWRRYTSYSFAAADAVCPLVGAELPKAVMSLPICFIEQEGRYVPAAVLGLQPGKSLFVAPDGRWIGNYVPAAFRGYPFRLASTADRQQVLCIDEDGGLITDGPAGEGFFNEDGQPAQALLDILNFLNQIEQSRVRTVAACVVLQKHNLIRPWIISVKTDSGDQNIEGLFQVDEAALNALSAEALFEVREAAALPIAYCQLLSMQHLPVLGQLAQAHAQKASQAQTLQTIAPNGELDLEFLNNWGTFNFGAFL